MNKKVIGMIAVVVLICVIGILAYFLFGNKEQENTSQTGNNSMNSSGEREEQDDSNNRQEENGNQSIEGKKVLVVYFSATNNTKAVAEKLSKNLNGDLFEIEPEETYTSSDLDWTNTDSRVSREHDDVSLRNIRLKNTKADDWESYDTVLIGYPIWWGVAAWPVNTFVKANDFSGKTVIPFATSASSGMGESGKLLEKEANGGTWLEGHRFSSYASDSDIKAFADSIK